MVQSTKEILLSYVQSMNPSLDIMKSKSDNKKNDKVTVIGAGTIGASCIFSLISHNISNNMVLIDRDLSLAKSEISDLECLSKDMKNPNLIFSSDYEASRNSKIVIITAGQTLMNTPEVDIDIINKNVSIYKEILPNIMKYSPHCIIIVVTNPTEIMSYIAWRITNINPYRIIGLGCVVLSNNFRMKIAEYLGISKHCLQAFVAGDMRNPVPLWSSLSAFGINLRSINKNIGTETDPEQWNKLFEGILTSLKNISKSKSFNIWGTAHSTTKVVQAILKRNYVCLPVASYLKNCTSEQDIYISLPCVLGYDGIVYIVRQNYTEAEKTKLVESTKSLCELITKIVI